MPKKIPRILTFDLMRGYFLVAIILDHLNFFPNGLDWWSARGSLFVTTAEGFFLISGIVLGIVRGAKLVDQPLRVVTKLLLRRSVQLYITSVVLVLLFTFLGWLFFMNNPGLKFGILPTTASVFEVIWKTLTLQYFYGWADYLRLYAIFILASPLAMWLLRRGKWNILLGISFIVWLLFPSSLIISDELQDILQPLSWQLLFFSGLIIGFHWSDITGWWRERSLHARRLTKISLFTISALALIIDIFLTFGPQLFNIHILNVTPEFQSYLYNMYFDKERLPIARIILFFIWFVAAFFLFNHFEPFIKRWFGWLLLPFGTNSLYVYTLHALILFFVHLYILPGNIFFNFVVTSAVIALIRIAIQYKFLMKVIPR